MTTGIRVALAGHPNSGKTTLFNRLCGTRERVGNWSGTTVERKEGSLEADGRSFTVVDLPGIYDLTANSLDEKIARNFLIHETPAALIAVVDATGLERNLTLVTQLLEAGRNVILVLNMMDRVRSRGMKIDLAELETVLGIPVLPAVASRGEGIAPLKKCLFDRLKARVSPLHIDYGDLEPGIRRIEQAISEKALYTGLPPRAAALRLLQGDPEIHARVNGAFGPAWMEQRLREIEKETLRDPETLVVEQRYGFLKGLAAECVTRHVTLEQRVTLSDRIDRVVTSSMLGLPIFLFIMYVLFTLVFKIGAPLSEWIDLGFGRLAAFSDSALLRSGFPEWTASLVSDGVINGVGSVLVFLPNILLLFLGISLLEQTGYLARAAFVMDRFMHTLGLHGKSFVPMLLGFGCSIPGILAARTLDSEKDRIITILVLPLMSCSARLPVYVLFASAFFERHRNLVVFALYLLGVLLAVAMARVFKWIFFREEHAPLIMEIPPYRVPDFRSVFIHMWIRAKLFLIKAGTVIFLAVVVVWFLASFPAGVEYASEHSWIGKIGGFISPVFRPAGFGEWQAAVALLNGVVAKEIIIGTLGTLYGAGEQGLTSALSLHFTPLSAFSFMVMVLIYTPCIAAVAVVWRETNWKWTMLSVGYTLVLGWGASVFFFQTGRLLFA